MPRFSLPSLLVLPLLLLAAACGSGGDGGDGGGTTGPDPTPVAPGSSVSYAAAPTLSGVAAAGAPLGKAQISVVDGKGNVVGTATSHAVDGSYSLTLTSKTVTVPLFVQARGLDAAGAPQVLHSAVPAMSAASAAMVANVTPLTNAVVALGLGSDPAPVFAAASTKASSLTQLGNAAAAAAAFLKTLVKTQLTDLKFSNAASLDLLGDASFAANKGAQDLLVESVRVSLGVNSQQLRIGNKLLPTLAQEVQVDLATAQTELLKSTGGTPATAITSTLKAATSAAGTLTNLGSLDELGAALNALIAQAPDLAAVTASPLLSLYDLNDGRSKAELAARLQGYAAKNWQFGRFQITGCADTALASGGVCSRVMVAAPVSDSSGTVVDFFADAVSFNKSSTTGSKWNLIGNGRDLAIALQPLAFLALNADGTTSTAVSPNPGLGIQVEIQAQDGATPAVQILSTATVQTPGGYSIPFAYCVQPLLCISGTPGATLLLPTGGVGDTTLQQAAVGWLGSVDTLAGAKYLVSYQKEGATAAQTRSVYLRAELQQTAPAAARFPTLDGVGAAAPLSAAAVLAGRSLNWSAWAAANPDLRLISVRTVFADGTTTPTITEASVPLPPSTTLALPALSLPSDLAPTTQELWLAAQDSAGRRFYTRYTLN